MATDDRVLRQWLADRGIQPTEGPALIAQAQQAQAEQAREMLTQQQFGSFELLGGEQISAQQQASQALIDQAGREQAARWAQARRLLGPQPGLLESAPVQLPARAASPKEEIRAFQQQELARVAGEEGRRPGGHGAGPLDGFQGLVVRDDVERDVSQPGQMACPVSVASQIQSLILGGSPFGAQVCVAPVGRAALFAGLGLSKLLADWQEWVRRFSEAIRRYFELLARIDWLVGQLGDKDWKVRQAAHKALFELARFDGTLGFLIRRLKELLESKDTNLEQKTRIKEILEQLHKVFNEPIAGWTDAKYQQVAQEILKFLSFTRDQAVKLELRNRLELMVVMWRFRNLKGENDWPDWFPDRWKQDFKGGFHVELPGSMK